MTRDPHAHVVKMLQEGGITLVLGAGVSMPRGIPSWPGLVRTMWKEAFGEEPGDDVLPASGNPGHPLTLPIAFEHLEEELGLAKFRRMMRKLLQGTRAPSTGDTLRPIASVIRREQARTHPRIQRVITFNADDLLERELHDDPDDLRRAPIIWPIVRESGNVRRERGFGNRPPIPVYHLHGFVPSHERWLWHEEAAESLIFTDAQYWSSVASPSSFANRVMMHALHDSHCVFIGMSMNDINLMRWFALRAAAISGDKAAQYAKKKRSGREARARALGRHHWFRKRPAKDASDLIGTHLARRGIRAIDVDDWAEIGRVLEAGFA